MKSRIHLAIGYRRPDTEMRRRLWVQFLTAVNDPAGDSAGASVGEIDMDVTKAAEELAVERLNGREIAYAVHTARTIARFEKQPLRLEHVRTVIGVHKGFDESLKRTAKRVSSFPLRGADIQPLQRQNSIIDEDDEDDEDLSP